MSDWDKIAADAAIEYAKPTMRPVQTMSDHMADAFHEGARWQREALLSDEAVEQAARALVWETTGGGYVKANDRDRGIARRILTAAIRGENDD